MSTVETKIKLDDLSARTIAVEIRPMPENVDASAVYPQLYVHGLAIITDNGGQILRLISDIQLDNDNPVMIHTDLVCLSEHVTVKEVRAVFETTAQKLVPLLDNRNRYTGLCASRIELQKLWAGDFEMPRVGGLATPLGVYLTTGVHTAGAGTYGLVLTGISFALFVMASQHGFQYLLAQVPSMQDFNYPVQMAIVFGLLLVIIRFTPLAGLHAAEHQTIHVIEKGLPLTPENVLAQPAAHRRCGTNVMVGLVGIEMGIVGGLTLEPIEYGIIFFILWAVFLVIGWQHLGILIQRIFTTSRPNRKQVDNAIRTGRALIEKYKMRPHKAPNMFQRIWRSGMLQVMGSFMFTYWVLQQIIDIWGKRL